MTAVPLRYEVCGRGESVVLIGGTGVRGRVWHLYQVPALVEAGYRVVTFDNRGIGPAPPGTPVPSGEFTFDDMVDDVVELMRSLGLAPCLMVGHSLGSFVVQELLVRYPDLVRRAVLMATRGRNDAFRGAVSAADRALYDTGAALPPAYRAMATMALNLSPATLNDPGAAAQWLDILETSNPEHGPGYRRQLDLDDMPDRLAHYRDIRVPALVLAFADDLLCPPHLAREVADALPAAAYQEVPGCGHFGYLERPDEVNRHLVGFLAGGTDGVFRPDAKELGPVPVNL